MIQSSLWVSLWLFTIKSYLMSHRGWRGFAFYSRLFNVLIEVNQLHSGLTPYSLSTVIEAVVGWCGRVFYAKHAPNLHTTKIKTSQIIRL